MKQKNVWTIILSILVFIFFISILLLYSQKQSLNEENTNLKEEIVELKETNQELTGIIEQKSILITECENRKADLRKEVGNLNNQINECRTDYNKIYAWQQEAIEITDVCLELGQSFEDYPYLAMWLNMYRPDLVQRIQNLGE